MLPGILNQLGAESLTHLKKLASNVNSLSKGDWFTIFIKLDVSAFVYNIVNLVAQNTIAEDDEDVPGE